MRVLLTLTSPHKTTPTKGPNNTTPKTTKPPRPETQKQKQNGGRTWKHQGPEWLRSAKERKRIQQRGSRPEHRQCVTKRKKQDQRQGGTEKSRTQPGKTGTSTREERGQSGGGRTTHGHRNNTHKEGKQGAGRQQRTGGERALKDQIGYSSALLDVQRGTWNINDEYLSASAQSNAKTYHSGVEGNNTPHRARPLVPQWKRRSESKEPPTLHTIAWQPSSTRGTILGGRHQ